MKRMNPAQRKGILLIVLLCLTSFAMISASVLYSSPDGTGEECTSRAPCALNTAIEKYDKESQIRCIGGTFKDLKLTLNPTFTTNPFTYIIGGEGENTQFENVEFTLNSPASMKSEWKLLQLVNATFTNNVPLIRTNSNLKQDVTIELNSVKLSNTLVNLYERNEGTNRVHVILDQVVISGAQLSIKKSQGIITLKNVNNDNGASITIDDALEVKMSKVVMDQVLDGSNMVSLTNITSTVSLEDSSFKPSASRALFIQMKNAVKQPNITLNNVKGGGNADTDGGAFKLINQQKDGSIVMNKCDFEMCSSLTNGGALSIEGNANLDSVTITGAFANEYGGAIYHTKGILTLNNVNMDSNISPLGGGAVASIESTGLNLLGATTATKNSAAFGGAFYLDFAEDAASRLYLDYKSALTIQYNDASSSGGAIFFTRDAMNPFEKHSELMDAIKDNGSPEQNANFAARLINSVDFGKFESLQLRVYFPTLSDSAYPSLKDLRFIDFFGNPITYTRRQKDAYTYLTTMKIVPSSHIDQKPQTKVTLGNEKPPFMFYETPTINYLPSKETPDSFELNTIKVAALGDDLQGSIQIQSPYYMNANASAFIPVSIMSCAVGHVSKDFKDGYSICGLNKENNTPDTGSTTPLMVRIAILVCICVICILVFFILISLSLFVNLSAKRNKKGSSPSKAESSKLLP